MTRRMCSPTPLTAIWFWFLAALAACSAPPASDDKQIEEAEATVEAAAETSDETTAIGNEAPDPFTPSTDVVESGPATRSYAVRQFDTSEFDYLACPRPQQPGQRGAYRFLLAVGDDSEGDDWEISIEPGWNQLELENRKAERQRMVLTPANTEPWRHILSPILNSFHGEDYCAERKNGTGKAPKLHLIAKIREEAGAAPLSIYPVEDALQPGWFNAALILPAVQQACDPMPADGECNTLTPRDAISTADEQSYKVFRPSTFDAGVSPKERLATAFGSALWLWVERYKGTQSDDDNVQSYERCLADTDDSDACYRHCSGVLIAPSLVMTNAHCIFLSTKSTPGVSRKNYPDRGLLRAWIRPIEGGKFELTRAPDLQRLTPVFVGEPGGPRDFAILKIEDRSRPDGSVGYALKGSLLPKPPAISAALPKKGDPITIVGYPGDEKLTVSIDNDCIIVKAAQGENILHRCDTGPGSSGSGVYDGALSKLVGLHNLGFVYKSNSSNSCPGKKAANCSNAAVAIPEIRQSIAAMMAAAKLLVKDGCSDLSRPRDPLAPEGWTMPLLDRTATLTGAKLLAAYHALPTALKTDLEICPAP